MIGHSGLLIVFISLARKGVMGMTGFTPRRAEVLGFAVQFNAKTPWHFASSAIVRSDSPQSNNSIQPTCET